MPPGYVRQRVGAATLVARDWGADALALALRTHGTLHRWAAAQQPRDEFRGRDTAYGVTLPAGAGTQASTPVVVRHSRHGGAFAAVTGDLFPRPTRAPRELALSLRLAEAGVPTPEVIAYAVHPVAGLLARSDVVTRRLPAGHDLTAAWRDAARRDAVLTAVGVLLRALSSAGAHHPDLNIKNIHVTDGMTPTACILDVDRVSFAPGIPVAARNFARLARSARKWRDAHGLEFTDDHLVRLAAMAWVEGA